MTSNEKTLRHMKRVQDLLGDAAVELIKRGQRHDLSKLSEAEAGPLAEMDALIEREGQAAFGSEEYERRRQLLGPMLAHHYANNSHHPEHYADGVAGMDLFDVLEMFVDWKAASERGEEASMGLEAAFNRFAIPEPLAGIIRNTAERLGWAH